MCARRERKGQRPGYGKSSRVRRRGTTTHNVGRSQGGRGAEEAVRARTCVLEDVGVHVHDVAAVPRVRRVLPLDDLLVDDEGHGRAVRFLAQVLQGHGQAIACRMPDRVECEI